MVFGQSSVTFYAVFQILWSVTYANGCNCDAEAGNSSEKLACRLFSNYNSSTSPNTTSQDYFQILDLTIFYAEIDVSGMFLLIGDAKAMWQDNQLTWDPSKYNGTYSLNIRDNFHQIWKPDFILINNAFGDNKPLFGSSHNATVMHNGTVTFWTKSFSMQARCQDSVKRKPWSDRICPLHFKTSSPNSVFIIHQQNESSPSNFFNHLTGADSKIESPWEISETQKIKQTDSSNESSNYSILIDVKLIRKLGPFFSTRCISFTVNYAEEIKCHIVPYSDLREEPSDNVHQDGCNLLMHILYIDLNIENGSFWLCGYATWKWVDKRLAWDSAKFGNTSVLKFEENSIWTPNLILNNELIPGTRSAEYFGRGHLRVSSNGNVTWILFMNINTRCDMSSNTRSWPWDPLKCRLNFTTNAPASTHLSWHQIELPKMELPWTVTEFSKDSKINYNEVIINITMKTKSNSLQVVLCSIFTAVSLLMLSSFLMSPISRIKQVSKISSVVLLAIFLVILMNLIPNFTSRAPNFLIGFIVLILIAGISSCISVYLVQLTRKSSLYDPSLNIKVITSKRTHHENDTMKRTLVEGNTPFDEDEAYTVEAFASNSEKYRHDWMKKFEIIEFSSFAICLIIVLCLITSLII